MILEGIISDGLGTSAPWFVRYREAYKRKTGLKVFPGTLNLEIDRELRLLDPAYAARVISMTSAEYGGARDILMLPCVLVSLGRLPAVIWRTDFAELQDPPELRQLEILAGVGLRSTYGLKNGDLVQVAMEVLG